MARLSQQTYEAVREGAIRSARTCLPMIAETHGVPSGLLDVGCGEGHWMRTAVELWQPRLSTVGGLDLVENIDDGFPFTAAWDAERGDLLPMRQGPHLTETREIEGEIYPASTDYRWPMVLCLEVAEHLSPTAGDHLIAELCRVSERVVFSAAIPGQGGDGHVNEQWPAYWGERFNAHGFFLSDPWRLFGDFWEDERIEPWYRQNLLMAQPATLFGDGRVSAPLVGIRTQPRSLVHPVTWLHHRGLS